MNANRVVTFFADNRAKIFRPKNFLPIILGIAFFSLIELFRVYVVVETGIWEEDSLKFYIHKLALFSLVAPFIYYLPKKVKAFIDYTAILITPALCFFILESFLHDPFQLSTKILAYNLLVFYLIFIFLSALFTRTDISLTLIAIVSTVVGFINFYTNSYRSTVVMPWDIASIGVALSVADKYEFPITPKLGLLIAFSFVLIYFSFLCCKEIRTKKVSSYCYHALAAFIPLLLSIVFLQTSLASAQLGLSSLMFEPITMATSNGSLVNFLMNLHFLFPEKPGGYSMNELQRISDSIDSQEPQAEPPDNIIVIMNESFCDLRTVCNYQTNIEFLPFLYSLDENALLGNLHVSIRGGNTPNTEFEALTGMTMAFLPSGSIAYSQYITKELPSTASLLDSLGYKTIAMHPYNADGWNRVRAYDFLGFDAAYFLEDFSQIPGLENIRYLISDRALYGQILDQINNSMQPTFIFAVTMQNHGGYTFSTTNLPLDVIVDGLEDELAVTVYHSLLKQSDNALKWLLEELDKSDETTVVLFFGDHQPGDQVLKPIQNMYGSKYKTSDPLYQESLHITPFLFWANYEIDTDYPKDISVNYLSPILFDICGLPKVKSYDFLLDLMDEYPIVSAYNLSNNEGDTFNILDYYEFPDIIDYAYIQYNYLFQDPSPQLWELNIK